MNLKLTGAAKVNLGPRRTVGGRVMEVPLITNETDRDRVREWLDKTLDSLANQSVNGKKAEIEFDAYLNALLCIRLKLTGERRSKKSKLKSEPPTGGESDAAQGQ